MFDDDEIAYLRSQRLARLATVDADGQPTVDAVGFAFTDGVFTIGSRADMRATRKGRNIEAGNTHVSLIVDDLASVDPWRPRGIRVHGEAEVTDIDGQFGPGTYVVVHPTITWSWGIAERHDFDAQRRFRPTRREWT
ncbi:MAG TPA: PPOX class F420-dependent oxidoreductase [Euzebyales bacterium]